MHRIEPALLLPGVTPDSLPGARPGDTPTASAGRLVRGKALIFWDPKVPGKKLDAIDTDQITPAADCVSESLETLDERWKAGSFRYLMPDFRARVHRGETFLIAGDRFAIGSSREMSPAGLKGVAEEAGLEMVVVCGNNMGDIFRRNSFNLGLQVVQSFDAVADAQDGDAFAFDPDTRVLTNETRSRTYEPVALTPKEDEIRRSGGIFALGRREFAESVTRTPEITWPDPDTARTLTTCRPPMAPRRSRSTPSTTSPVATRSGRARSRSRTTISCSPASRPTTSRPRSDARSRRRTDSSAPTTRRRATGSSTSISPSRAW